MDDTLLLLTVAAAALIVGLAAGWAVHSAVTRRKLTREQGFFGLPDGSECVLVTHRDSSSAHWSIPRHDALALLGLAAVIENCGAHPEIAPHDTGLQGFGRVPSSVSATRPRTAGWRPTWPICCRGRGAPR